jgi:hypothetical protein
VRCGKELRQMPEQQGSKGGDTREKSVGYYKVCWWNEKQINKRLLELMNGKDKTIEMLQLQLKQKQGGKS